MVVLISGASHTGKTLLAQRLTKRHGCDYILIDGEYDVDLQL